MPDWPDLQARAREDVEKGLEVWTELLRESLGADLLCAYAKGSALKAWEGPIDYVPELSDVDIHLLTSREQGLFRSAASAFDEAHALSRRYEERFRAAAPGALHLPRSQLVVVNDLVRDETFVQAPARALRPLVGSLPPRRSHTPDEVRAIDRRHLLELEEFLATVPGSLADRSGFDLWSLLRRLTWRVSPTPVRLLSLRREDPLEAWTWNRSEVVRRLRSAGFGSIADDYERYYLRGWDLFLSRMRDSGACRAAIVHGHAVLRAALEEARRSS